MNDDRNSIYILCNKGAQKRGKKKKIHEVG
jgi:hypothetical protein